MVTRSLSWLLAIGGSWTDNKSVDREIDHECHPCGFLSFRQQHRRNRFATFTRTGRKRFKPMVVSSVLGKSQALRAGADWRALVTILEVKF